MNIMKKQGATLVQRASAKIAGFKTLHKRLEKKIIVSGKSMSTLNNYMRCISHLALHFSCLPTELDLEQIEEYLVHLKKKGLPKRISNSLSSASNFFSALKVSMTRQSSCLP